MHNISFAEAQRLINAQEAGFYCIGANQSRPHAIQICVYVQHEWYLFPTQEFRLVDQGITGNEGCWMRTIRLEIDSNSEIVTLLLKEAQKQEVSLIPLDAVKALRDLITDLEERSNANLGDQKGVVACGNGVYRRAVAVLETNDERKADA